MGNEMGLGSLGMLTERGEMKHFIKMVIL